MTRSAALLLRSVEMGALSVDNKNSIDTSKELVSSISSLEENVSDHPSTTSRTRRSFYTGNGKDTRSKKSWLKKGIPAAIITALLGGGAATIMGSTSLLGPHLSALYTAATDTQYASTQLRIGRLGLTMPRSKQGRATNFFDESANKIYKKLGLSRDVFNSYKASGDNNVDETAYRETMDKYFDGDSDTRINTAEDRTTTGEDGKETTERVKNGEDASTKGLSGESMQKARAYLDSVGNKVAAANIGCAVLKVGNLIAVAVAANEIYQSINYFMTNTENISKTMAGDGDAAATNQFLNRMTETKTTTVYDSETGNPVEITGSALQSEGSRVVLGDLTADRNNSKNYSVERAFKSTLAAITMAGYTTTACAGVRAAGAIISLAISLVPGGGFVRTAAGLLLNTIIGVGVTIAATSLLSFLIPTIAQSMFSNVFENATGVAAGELYSKGASAANTRVARSSSGQSPSSAEEILAYNQANEEIIARDAARARENLSPFDYTSEYTFLGSIVSTLLPLATSVTSAFNLTTTLTSITNTSVAKLSSTYAAGEDSSYMTSFGDCPTLEAIGAKGDIYCNPITTTDLSTIDITPDDPTYRSVINPNIETDSDGNEVVKDNSNLANYIMYCTERDSPFGVYDANIANAYELSLGVVGDNLPILSDILDLVNAAQYEDAEPWATGANCVNSSSNSLWDSEMKYYQAYVEINRLEAQAGNIEHSPVTAYKDKYYEENPIDDSVIGYLSRISGMTTTDSEIVLGLLDYYEEVSNYNPSTAYYFGDQTKSKEISFETNSFTDQLAIITKKYLIQTRDQGITA